MMDFDSVDHPGRFFSLLARDLKSLALSNIQFFQNGKQSHHAKFHVSFSLLYEYLDVGIEPSYRELSKTLQLYDFSPEVKGNGYRSLLQVVHKCCLHLLQLSRYIFNVKDSMLFRKRYYAKELEAYVSALGQLRAILYYALKLLNYCQEGELFADDESLDNTVADHLMMEVETLNQECFYGRCLGFQFCESMMRPVQIMSIAMASYSEGYLESSGMMQVATSVFNSGKYFMDPELRATQVAKVTRTADIQFCKAFWSISESALAQQLPSMVCPSVEVNELFPLGPDAFELPLVDGSDTVVITPPCAHVGPGHVMVRLLSAQLRDGQQTLIKSSKSKSPMVAKPKTPGLIIHIHGGGFIAQSSKSHEMYLRDWARIVDIPILSVDYSLAPELPFPRALEDCFYAYAWAVRNCEQLGSLGERIVMCGDSAGGNLAISTAMRAASFGIRRPDGVLGIYPVTMARYLPSPARLLSLMDPILPVGIVSRCLAAYAGINEQHPLASPSTQEFQSKSSLNTIQMQTAESSDTEWVIIGQDQNECDQIGQRMDQSSPTHTTLTSPDSACATKSVIDSLEDSYNEDEMMMESSSSILEEGMGGKRKLYRSDTLESDEVEIFSQLRDAGSCVIFSKEDGEGEVEISTDDGKVKENRKCRDMGKQSSSSGGSKGSEKEKTKNEGGGGGGKVFSSSKDALAENLMSFQETAKSVMEGAQSMLTSLSSYIPSRVSVATTATANPESLGQSERGTGGGGGSMTTKSTTDNFYVNRSISSDAVDPSSLVCKSDEEEEEEDVVSAVPSITSKSEELSVDGFSGASPPVSSSSGGRHRDNNKPGEIVDVLSDDDDDSNEEGRNVYSKEAGTKYPPQQMDKDRSGNNENCASRGHEPVDGNASRTNTDEPDPESSSHDGNVNAVHSSPGPHLIKDSNSNPSTALSPSSTSSSSTSLCLSTSLLANNNKSFAASNDENKNRGHNFDSTISPVSDDGDNSVVIPADLAIAVTNKPTVGMSPIVESPPPPPPPPHSSTSTQELPTTTDLSLSRPLTSSSTSQSHSHHQLHQHNSPPPPHHQQGHEQEPGPSSSNSSSCLTSQQSNPVPCSTTSSTIVPAIFPPPPSQLDFHTPTFDPSTQNQTTTLTDTTTTTTSSTSTSHSNSPDDERSRQSEQFLTPDDDHNHNFVTTQNLSNDKSTSDLLSKENLNLSKTNNNNDGPSAAAEEVTELASHSSNNSTTTTTASDDNKENIHVRNSDLKNCSSSSSSPSHIHYPSISSTTSSPDNKNNIVGVAAPAKSSSDSNLNTIHHATNTNKDSSSSSTTTTTSSDSPNHIYHSPPPHLHQRPTSLTTTTTTNHHHKKLNNNNKINNNIIHSSDDAAVLSLSPSPSPNQVFSENGATGFVGENASDLDSTDTDMDGGATFKTSCLEFLGPHHQQQPSSSSSSSSSVSMSPMPNDPTYYASQHVISQNDIEARLKLKGEGGEQERGGSSSSVSRSDSMPALAFSALLSPMSPVDPQVKGGDDDPHRHPPLPFPNGLKMGMSPSDFKRQTFTSHSPVNTMRKALVVRNPYMSPLMADAELLQGLPPVCIVASHLDPLLDDSVMFAKRLQRLGKPVELHLVDDLPHGFLNFSLMSQEAKKASQFCARTLLEMINGHGEGDGDGGEPAGSRQQQREGDVDPNDDEL